MDLETLMSECYAELKDSGRIKEIMKNTLDKTMLETIETLFGRWSPFSKDLRDRLSKELRIDFEKMSLPEYNKVIVDQVKEIVDTHLVDQGMLKVKQELDSYLGAEGAREYKLSEIVEAVKQEVDEGEYPGDEMTVLIDEDRTVLTFVSLDADPGKSEWECKYRLAIAKDGKLNSASINGSGYGAYVKLGDMDKAERLLYKIYATGSTIIVDTDDIDTEYPNPEEI